MRTIRLLYVCTGNTCRSPMAAALTEKLGKELALPYALEVRSRGLYAAPGDPLSQYAREALGERGIEMEHQAAMLEEEDMKWADLVLTMTMQHKRHLWEEFPDFQDKTFTLKEYIREHGPQKAAGADAEATGASPAAEAEGPEESKAKQPQESGESGDGPDDFSWEYLESYFSSLDVRDPFGGELEVYRQTRDELEENIRHLLQLLAASVSQPEDAL